MNDFILFYILSESSVFFLAAFYSSSLFPVTLACFSSNFGVILKESYISRDLNFEWSNQCAGVLLSLNIFWRHAKLIYSFITTPWIHPLKFIPVYLKFPITPFLIFLCYLSLYFILLFLYFFSVIFSLFVVAFHLR